MMCFRCKTLGIICLLFCCSKLVMRIKRRELITIQGTFWAWAHPIKDNVTLLRRLSLAAPIPRMIPAIHQRLIINHTICWNFIATGGSLRPIACGVCVFNSPLLSTLHDSVTALWCHSVLNQMSQSVLMNQLKESDCNKNSNCTLSPRQTPSSLCTLSTRH